MSCLVSISFCSNSEVVVSVSVSSTSNKSSSSSFVSLVSGLVVVAWVVSSFGSAFISLAGFQIPLPTLVSLYPASIINLLSKSLWLFFLLVLWDLISVITVAPALIAFSISLPAFATSGCLLKALPFFL